MKPVDIDAIRARAEKATAGPWKNLDDEGVEWNEPIACAYDSHSRRYWSTGPEVHSKEQVQADSQFIAHAREDVPALLKLVDEMTRVLLAVDQPDERIIPCLVCDDADESMDGHTEDCAVDAVLTAAGLDTYEKRAAARERLKAK
jgi:hypothetical protein